MKDRYPGYDVLAKRHSPSWNAQTRRVIDARLAVKADSHRFFTDAEWPTVLAICARVIPQKDAARSRVPIAALIDIRLFENHTDGYRDARLPPWREAWRRALLAVDLESRRIHGARFHELSAISQDDLLKALQEGRTDEPAWGDMPPRLFFVERLLHDIVTTYYSHPAAWSEIGFGGPAGPRGYVRMDADRLDPWEAAQARPGLEDAARRHNVRIR